MTEKLIKVRFELDQSDWHGHGSETLWASPIVESESRNVRIVNLPFLRQESAIVILSKHRHSTTTSYSISRKLLRGAVTRRICFFSKLLKLASSPIGICWKKVDVHTKVC